MGTQVILIALIGIIAGCAAIPNYNPDPRQIWCDTNSPRRDATETTPRAEIDDINAHNRKGELWCGWRP